MIREEYVMGPFGGFAYPDIATAIAGGALLVGISYVLRLAGGDFSSIPVFFAWYLGVLIVFFGLVWYGFNWFIDYGVKLID